MNINVKPHAICPKLPDELVPLANRLSLPWRDAGCRDIKRKAVAPHKCRKERKREKKHGEYVTIEIRK